MKVKFLHELPYEYMICPINLCSSCVNISFRSCSSYADRRRAPYSTELLHSLSSLCLTAVWIMNFDVQFGDNIFFGVRLQEVVDYSVVGGQNGPLCFFMTLPIAIFERLERQLPLSPWRKVLAKWGRLCGLYSHHVQIRKSTRFPLWILDWMSQ